MNELALFAGAGGGILGSLLLGHRIVGAVEIDPYCREVLLRRQEEGHLPPFPIWDDIRTFDGRPWRRCVDIVSAGFPCQPFSVAGKRLAQDDERNMWPETIRVIREVRPRFAFLENVPGLRSGRHGYFGVILRDLAQSGFSVEWGCVSAAEVGAPHKRDRLWIMANASSRGTKRLPTEGKISLANPHGGCQDVADPAWVLEGRQEQRPEWERAGKGGESGDVADTQCGDKRGSDEWGTPGIGWWEREPLEALQNARREGREKDGESVPESLLGRVAHGVAYRVDRLRALGNGQVPIVAATAARILGLDSDREEKGESL